nr:EOG090X0KPP [Macrothrix elegans]
MSKATKRKHVTKEVLDEYALPDERKIVAKILGGKGNNLHEVETGNGEKYLVSMPSKYRKNVWIKRGDYVLIEPIEEGDKVKAEITHILYSDQIKYIQNHNLWPQNFVLDKTNGKQDASAEDEIEVNPNRFPYEASSSENSDSSEAE